MKQYSFLSNQLGELNIMYASHKPYNARAFELFWKPFVRFFQILCVSHYSIFYRKQRSIRIVYFIVASTLHTVLMFYTVLYGLHIQIRPNERHKESTLMFYVNFLSMAGNFVTHTMAHAEAFFTQNQENEIYRRLNEINEMFSTEFNYIVDFDAIKRKHMQHTVLFYFCSATVSFCYSFFSLPTVSSDAVLFSINRILAVIVIRARRCYAAQIINMQTIILRDLQILLKRQQQNYRPHTTNAHVKSNANEKIHYLRDIYSNIWMVNNLISGCFGWSLVTFLLEFSFDLINASYWAYSNIKSNESRNKVIRKCWMRSISFVYWDLAAVKIRFFVLFSEIICYMTSVTVNFWYICMITERCQNAVSLNLMGEIRSFILKDVIFVMDIGERSCKSITHTIELSRSKLSAIHSHFFTSTPEAADSIGNERNVYIQLCSVEIGMKASQNKIDADKL